MANEPASVTERTSHRWLDPLDLSLRITLAALLFRPIGAELLRPAFLALAIAGLVIPRLLRRPILWGLLAALAAFRVIEDWPLPDNHAYLLVYWCLAIAVALRHRDPLPVLALNARLLIGLVFAFAAAWKLVLSPDYLNGDFMRFIWIVDERFEGAALIFGGLDRALLDQSRAFLAGALSGPDPPALPDAFIYATRISTLWTALIEPLVALAFLLPLAHARLGWERLRDASLLLFCATVYAAAPVAGFAWLLLAMGSAQVPIDRARTRVAYLACCALILVYREIPWTAWS